MTDRERWIVYPLLLMALGLALQPKLGDVDARLGVVRCRQLICREVVADRADVSQQRADAVVGKQLVTQALLVTDESGVRQAQVVASKQGGRIDVDRYAVTGVLPFQDRTFEIFAVDKRGIPLPLGVATLHLVAENPKSEHDAAKSSDAADTDRNE